MRFRRIALGFAVAGATVVHAGAPSVSEVTMSQAQSRLVTITYSLDMPAVVTLDIQTNAVSSAGSTNWVTIGGENIGSVVGDANILVKEAGTHTIYWQPDKSWPNHRIRDNGARAVVRAWASDAPPDWMMIDLSAPSNVYFYASVAALPYGHPTNAAYKTTCLLMRKISAAGRSFRMGLCAGEGLQSCFVDGSTYTSWGDFQNFITKAAPHLVSFTNDYYISIFQFTDGQQVLATGAGSNRYRDSNTKIEPYDECPSSRGSYGELRGAYDASKWNWPRHAHEISSSSVIGKIRQFTGVEVDLPTEAQWEYACRAGESRYRYDGAFTAIAEGAGELGWYNGNSGNKMHPVGLKKPNAWGIYDMYGNGYEWCLDYYEAGYTGCGTVEPTGPEKDSGDRVLRGCRPSHDARYMSSAWRLNFSRGSNDDWNTFRLAAPAVAK